MKGVTVVDHPLVQHKLTLIRQTDTSTKSFRELCRELGILLCYEITRDLPFEGTPVLSDDEFERAAEEIEAIASEAVPVLV